MILPGPHMNEDVVMVALWLGGSTLKTEKKMIFEDNMDSEKNMAFWFLHDVLRLDSWITLRSFEPTAAIGEKIMTFEENMTFDKKIHLAGDQGCGVPLRAILAPPDARNAENSKFEMLFLRFRENEERENLSPFERLVSIGEMYETLASGEENLTAVALPRKLVCMRA